MMQWLAVAVGGAAGAVARHGLSLATTKLFGAAFPWGTLLVNLLGCAAIGVAFVLLGERPGSPTLRALVMTGLLGGFTTFSAFALETHALAEAGSPGRAAGYVLASVALCLAGCWLGVALARRLI
jgi:CrcB protein